MDEEKAFGRTESNVDREGEKSTARSLRIKAAEEDLEKHRAVLEQLRAWRDWEKSRRASFRLFLLGKIYPKRPPRPPKKELQSLKEYFFPPRPVLNVTICDFGNKRFERHDTNIEKLEACESRATGIILASVLTSLFFSGWQSKPDWVTVRWM